MNSLEIELDQLWRKAVITKALNKCELCLSKQNLDAHHIYGRGKAVRWELENGICLWRTCHAKAHQNNKKFRKEYGTERLDKLCRTFAKDIEYNKIKEGLNV